MSQLPAAAEALVVNAEVSSRPYYDKVLHRPEWPGGSSGVTVGIGYDLGMTSAATIAADWGPRVSSEMLSTMQRCAGVHGDAARVLLPSVKPLIDIPWESAMAVFEQRDVPKYLAVCRKHLPNFDLLSSVSQGALWSLAYNRDAGLFENSVSDRAREMHAIKLYMASKQFAKIPGELRSMKRLWPTMRGLQTRRDAEAALFEHGLLEPAVREQMPHPVAPQVPPATGVAPTEDVWVHLFHRGLSYLENLK